MNYLFVLGLAAYASAFSMRAVDPMLNQLVSDLNLTLAQAASLAGAFAFPYATMQLVFGPIGDAVGKVRLIRFNLTMVAIGLAASAMAPTHEVLFAARVLSGAFGGGIIPVAFATVGDRASFDQRPVALSRVLLALILGQLSGSAAAGVITDLLGWRYVFWVGCVVAVSALVATTFFIKDAGRREPLSFVSAVERYRIVLSNPLSVRVYGVVVLEGALIFGVFPLMAPLMVAHGLGDALEAGLVLGAFAVGGAFYSTAVPVLVRHLGLQGMVATGACGVGALFLVAAVTPNLILVIGLFAVAGFFFYMIHNMLQLNATELAPAARGSAMALFACSYFMGQGIGAVVMGSVAERVGPQAVYLLAGAAMILLAWPAAHLLRNSAMATQPTS